MVEVLPKSDKLMLRYPSSQTKRIKLLYIAESQDKDRQSS